ncbi:polyprenol monophosphomannose synthase [uncultured Amnibacterium sp.]|uniref:polyprenol monophosphomannose synthase n=1 Tax=uncultured Amnibacterium sp. TaxID=1631851 RepID=UPI0035C960B4
MNDATRSNPASTVIIIPTYDEVENIENAVAAVLGNLPDAHVLIVDDASPDGTGVIADRLANQDERVRVLHRASKDGLGGAYIAGFRWALERDYALVGEFDADGSHPASSLPVMQRSILASDDIGLVIGSRWVRGGRVLNWPKSREALSRGGNAYARLMLGLGVHDVTAGFRLYRGALLGRIDMDSVASKGYCFQVDLTVRTLAAGGRVEEVPISFQERVLGVSKMSRSIVLEAMWMVTIWGVARALGAPGRALAGRVSRPVASLQSQVDVAPRTSPDFS